MSTSATAAESGQKPAKSKKLLIIGAAVVLLLVVAGAAAAWVVSSRQALDEDGEPIAKGAAHVSAPTFLPLETMVVNLADPGGERFAQIGITLELQDSKTVDAVKQYMPSIRSGILMLISQRHSDELLLREGKEKLAADVAREVARPLGFTVAKAAAVRDEAEDANDGYDEEVSRKRRKDAKNPVRRVHFSGFIIQ